MDFLYGAHKQFNIFTILGYVILKTIPFYKLPMALLLLMPMTLSLGAALTSDVVVIGVNFLWIAVLLKFLVEDKLINYSKIFILFLLAFIIGLAKNYFLLIPLIFIVPKSKFKNLMQYLICIFGVLTITIIMALIWQNIITYFGFNMNANANYAEQLKFILSNPIEYLFILLKTFVIKIGRIIITMIGVLGWQDTRLDFLTYILYPALIILSVITEDKTGFYFKKRQNIVLISDIILSFFLIFTTIYLMWSNIGSQIIMGLSGKYFIPIMLPIILLFYNRLNVSKYRSEIRFIIFIFIILILASSDLSLIHRFYNMTPNLYYKI